MNPLVKIWLNIIGLVIVPVGLMQTGIIPASYHSEVLGAVFLVTLTVIIRDHWSLRELGIRTDNIRAALLPYVLFTLVGLACIALLAWSLGRTPQSDWFQNPYFVYLLFIPVSFFQQFGFSAFFMPQVKALTKHPFLAILLFALLFTYIHIIFPDSSLMLPFAFAAGLGFGTMYYFYPNLLLISLSHMVLNLTAVSYCFFTFATNCSL